MLLSISKPEYIGIAFGIKDVSIHIYTLYPKICLHPYVIYSIRKLCGLKYNIKHL